MSETNDETVDLWVVRLPLYGDRTYVFPDFEAVAKFIKDRSTNNYLCSEERTYNIRRGSCSMEDSFVECD